METASLQREGPTSDQEGSQAHSEKGMERMGKNWYFVHGYLCIHKTVSPNVHFLEIKMGGFENLFE